MDAGHSSYITAQELLVCKNYLNHPKELTVGSKTYVAWYNPEYKAINLQEKANYNAGNQGNKIGININEANGQVRAVWINGTQGNSTSIPTSHLERIKACCTKAQGILPPAPAPAPVVHPAPAPVAHLAPTLNASPAPVTPADLLVCKNYLNQPKEVKVGNKTYIAWYNPAHKAINLQLSSSYYEADNNNKIGININEANGQIISLWVNGTNAGNSALILQQNLEKIRACCNKAYAALNSTQAPIPGTIQPPVLTATATATAPAIATATATATAPAIPAPVPMQFSSDDLVTFKTALVKTGQQEIFFDDAHYVVWYNKENKAISIQHAENYNKGNQGNKIGVTIGDDGKIRSVWVNGTALPGATTIPDEQYGKMRDCFKKALEFSSEYAPMTQANQDSAKIKMIRRGLKEVPEYHMEELANLLRSGFKFKNDPKFQVIFLNNDQTTTNGIDAGGLSRDYLNDLFEGCLSSSSLSMQKLPSFVLPRTKEECEAEKPLPSLGEAERRIYNNMGQIMMYAYNSAKVAGHWDTTCLLGRHFNDGLYKAVLCLNAEEIDTSFRDLSFKTKMKLCKALLEVGPEIGITIVESLEARIRAFENFAEVLNSDEKLEEAATTALYAECLPDDLQSDYKPDLVAIRANPERFKQALWDSIFCQESDCGKIGALLAPIHAIAGGMKSFCRQGNNLNATNSHWDNNISRIKHIDFSVKVQGSINRTEIIDSIQVESNNQYLRNKVKWLKEWLSDSTNGASDDDIRNFLKFTTGSSSLPVGKKITVTQQLTDVLPFPKTHTCSFELQLSGQPNSIYGPYNDSTKENFIRALKEVVLSNPDAYQTA
jgi:HECT-domain (ubiquitin-transferase)